MEKYRLIQDHKVVVAGTANSTTTTGTISDAVEQQQQQSYVVDTEEGGGIHIPPSSVSGVTPTPAQTTAAATIRTSTTSSSNSKTMTDHLLSHYPEVRITQQGKPRNYISYAMNLLSDSTQPTIVLKAMGRAINKAVTIAEILKRKMPLHQWNILSSLEMIDLYEPIEEGLDIVENRRYVSCLTILLSLTVSLSIPTITSTTTTTTTTKGQQGNEDIIDEKMIFDIHHFGYQPPLPITELQQQQHHHHHHAGTSYHHQQQHHYTTSTATPGGAAATATPRKRQ